MGFFYILLMAWVTEETKLSKYCICMLITFVWGSFWQVALIRFNCNDNCCIFFSHCLHSREFALTVNDLDFIVLKCKQCLHLFTFLICSEGVIFVVNVSCLTLISLFLNSPCCCCCGLSACIDLFDHAVNKYEEG